MTPFGNLALGKAESPEASSFLSRAAPLAAAKITYRVIDLVGLSLFLLGTRQVNMNLPASFSNPDEMNHFQPVAYELALAAAAGHCQMSCSDTFTSSLVFLFFIYLHIPLISCFLLLESFMKLGPQAGGLQPPPNLHPTNSPEFKMMKL